MELSDCLTGLEWVPATSRKSAARLARKRMADKGKLEAVWVVCVSEKKPPKIDFAVLSGTAKGRVAAAAAFARGIGSGILIERLPNGFYWLAVALDGVPLPGFDREQTRDDALSAAATLPESLRMDIADLHVPPDFPQYHAGCRNFAQITERVRPQDVSFRPIERGVNPVVLGAAAFSVALVYGVGGFFWWKSHLDAERQAKLAAEMRQKEAMLAHEHALSLQRQTALQKALVAYKTAMGKLDGDWSQSMSIRAAEYVGALVSEITPTWGWTPVDFQTRENLLVSHWVSDIPGHPDYIDFMREAKSSDWSVTPNTYYTVLTLSRRVPDALSKVLVNPGYADIGLVLNSLPAEWKVGSVVTYAPLSYLRRSYQVKGQSLSALSQTLHILKQIPGMRISTISVNHTGWSLALWFFEKTNRMPTVSVPKPSTGVPHVAH